MADKVKMVVDKERWKAFDENERSWLIYDTLQEFDKRLRTLEGRKLIDKSLTLVGGAIGGAAAFLGLKLWR